MIESSPKFLQGVFAFTGAGYAAPRPLGDIRYVVPSDKRSQLIYFRAGNSSPEMVSVLLLLDGRPTRYFPVGARAATHVPLAVVQDLQPDQRIDLLIAAPEGCSGTVVLDIGLLEI